MKPVAISTDDFLNARIVSAQHTPGPQAEKVEHIKQTIDTLAECAAVLPQAIAFTYTVERFMRADDDRVPPTEAEVAEAMYALRAAIAKATGSAAQ